MNKQVLNILEIVDTTCHVHRIDASWQDRTAIAVNCWLQCGDDKEKIISYLHGEIEPLMQHAAVGMTPATPAHQDGVPLKEEHGDYSPRST